jgi:hypothetical protein
LANADLQSSEEKETELYSKLPVIIELENANTVGYKIKEIANNYNMIFGCQTTR